MDFDRRNTHSNTDSDTQTNINTGPVTTARDYTVRQGHLWNYRTYTTTLQYRCCTQTDNHFTATGTSKNNGFNEQNNNSARASRFFVHSFAFTAQLRREMTKF